MSSRALFLTADKAKAAARQVGKRKSVVNDYDLHRLVQAWPVYKRGELAGYEGWYPADISWKPIRNPVLDTDMDEDGA